MTAKPSLRVFLAALVLCCAVVTAFATPGKAQDGGALPAPPINVLDGQKFAGEFIASDKSSGRPDAFIFANGKFHSRQCLNLGFSPGPYWVRLERDQVHFYARLTSEENGVMTYEGSVKSGKIDARIEWIKPRWYWTMKRDFNFRGQHDTNATAARN